MGVEKPEKPNADASSAEIYSYLIEYEEWAQIQGAKEFPDRIDAEADE